MEGVPQGKNDTFLAPETHGFTLHSDDTLALKIWPTTKKVDKLQPRSEGSLLPDLRSERKRERERETLENAGHVSPRIWQIKNKRFGGGAGNCEICLYRS